MKTRLATFADLSAIMRIEAESFGEAGEATMASQELMRSRIIRCNERVPGWFWVAEEGGCVHGYLVLQPTSIAPDECRSWDHATDNGTFEKTFVSDGDTIFGVSIGTGHAAPEGAVYMLIFRGMLLLAQTGKKRLMLCSRMPGFQKAHEQTGIPADEYWRLRNTRGAPKDPMLRMFFGAFGVGPYAFMRNGFPPDVESGGHSALVVVENPHRSLELLAERIYAAGQRDAQK